MNGSRTLFRTNSRAHADNKGARHVLMNLYLNVLRHNETYRVHAGVIFVNIEPTAMLTIATLGLD